MQLDMVVERGLVKLSPGAEPTFHASLFFEGYSRHWFHVIAVGVAKFGAYQLVSILRPLGRPIHAAHLDCSPRGRSIETVLRSHNRDQDHVRLPGGNRLPTHFCRLHDCGRPRRVPARSRARGAALCARAAADPRRLPRRWLPRRRDARASRHRIARAAHERMRCARLCDATRRQLHCHRRQPAHPL